MAKNEGDEANWLTLMRDTGSMFCATMFWSETSAFQPFNMLSIFEAVVLCLQL